MLQIMRDSTATIGRVDIRLPEHDCELDEERFTLRGRTERTAWALVLNEDELPDQETLATYIESQQSLVTKYVSAALETQNGSETVSIARADEARSVVYQLSASGESARVRQIYVRKGRWVGVLTLTLRVASDDSGFDDEAATRLWADMIPGISVSDETSRRPPIAIARSPLNRAQAFRDAAALGVARVQIAK